MTAWLSCNQVIDLLCEYLEDDVTPDLREQIDYHLRRCRDCSIFLDQYRNTTSICRETLAREMPAELEQHMLEVLRDRLGTTG